MEREFSLDGMLFDVIPALQEGFNMPWYNTAKEVLDAVMQLLKLSRTTPFPSNHSSKLSHALRNRISARALDSSQSAYIVIHDRISSIKRRFRVRLRYYYIDCELSVRFPVDSEPSERLVTGMPLARYGLEDSKEYGRDIAPEMLLKNPYDPFKTDIFQLGKLFCDHFYLMEEQFPVLIDVFQKMMSESPGTRPAALEALDIVRDYRDTFTGNQLKVGVVEPQFAYYSRPSTEERQARKTVGKAAEEEAESKLRMRQQSVDEPVFVQQDE